MSIGLNLFLQCRYSLIHYLIVSIGLINIRCRFKGYNTVTPDIIGAFTYNVPLEEQLEVHQGDLIGVLITEGIIPYTQSTCSQYNKGGFAHVIVENFRIPSAGEDRDFTVQKNTCRIYPIKAHIESIP